MYGTTKPTGSSLHERAYRIVLYSAGEMCMRRRSPLGLVYTNVHTGSYFIVRDKCVWDDEARGVQSTRTCIPDRTL